ncbi:hypothetical protein ABMA27_010369 [Loxostege sticticalis]|uniref:Helitron helicase-like domain-containing protein n=1 Tax=Loxostege sticticalis TaxID=481309 RepID=A0ABR3H5U0_LOXSC
MQQDTNTENLERLVILPSSFTGGPRYMHERTQDAFSSFDRHDIISRVLHLKMKLMIDLLTKEKVFGETLCFMYSVKWQKRGLPHAHILLWLVHKIRPNDVYIIISAEFPNPNEDPILHNIIKMDMVHGPCGSLKTNSPCMQNGQWFPKAMNQQTITGEDGYPNYRRSSLQQGGFAAEIRLRGQQQMVVDNRWVVPYSPVLSKTFNAHINVEMCNSVMSVKYICKYVNKGSDQAEFQSGRYISSSEAVWRILSFPINERFPRLEYPRQTTLLAFFQLCQIDEFAKTLLYDEVPAYYIYDKQRGMFNRRKRGTPVDSSPGIFKDHVLGRVYMVHPLHIVRGPISFDALLKQVDDMQHPTFQAACRERGLMDDDQHWDAALNEACVSDNLRRLRHLFSVMLVFCALSDAALLWQKYQNNLAEDYIRDMHQSTNDLNNQQRQVIFNRCLNEIQDIVLSIGGNSLSYYGLPDPPSYEERDNREYSAERNYDSTELLNTLRVGIPALTNEQRNIFHRVCNSVIIL